MRKCCLILMMLLVLVPCIALAQASGVSAVTSKEELDIWNVDFDKLDTEDRKELERLKEEARQDRLEKMRKESVPKEKDYDNNTVCSFGPQFRDVSPRMTDLWYMFTPVDLSMDGTQTFDLIAGNLFVVGKVSVTVKNGKFQVDYHYNSARIQTGREYFNIFPDYKSIEESDLENLHTQKRFSYGKAYSIADKLEGDTNVILFVCNTATFKKTTNGVGASYKTHPDRVAQRETILEMIEK